MPVDEHKIPELKRYQGRTLRIIGDAGVSTSGHQQYFCVWADTGKSFAIVFVADGSLLEPCEGE